MREALYTMTEFLHCHYDRRQLVFNVSAGSASLHKSSSSADNFTTDGKHVRTFNTRDPTSDSP